MAVVRVLALIGVVVLSASCARRADPDVERLLAIASDDPGLTFEEQQLVTRLQARRGEVIDRLLPLLKSPRPGARELAASALAGIDGLEERHLDALIAAYDDGVVWVDRAIARIGTDRALDFLAEDFRMLPKLRTPYALAAAGPRGLERLAALYRTVDPVHLDRLRSIRLAFGGGPAPQSAVRVLAEVAGDAGVDLRARRMAVGTLGNLGESAKPALPVLRSLVGSVDGAEASIRRIDPPAPDEPSKHLEALRYLARTETVGPGGPFYDLHGNADDELYALMAAGPAATAAVVAELKRLDRAKDHAYVAALYDVLAVVKDPASIPAIEAADAGELFELYLPRWSGGRVGDPALARPLITGGEAWQAFFRRQLDGQTDAKHRAALLVPLATWFVEALKPADLEALRSLDDDEARAAVERAQVAHLKRTGEWAAPRQHAPQDGWPDDPMLFPMLKAELGKRGADHALGFWLAANFEGPDAPAEVSRVVRYLVENGEPDPDLIERLQRARLWPGPQPTWQDFMAVFRHHGI